ncbi:coiled-coil domain-containing protein 1-like, partial [Stegodyphus dumicola]|uniref:coiled-coil domain-containing protein 1-like n=1 Tax=Stegodyphus dumicola TaxID=202533 RepID=UPI0015A96F2E
RRRLAFRTLSSLSSFSLYFQLTKRCYKDLDHYDDVLEAKSLDDDDDLDLEHDDHLDDDDNSDKYHLYDDDSYDLDDGLNHLGDNDGSNEDLEAEDDIDDDNFVNDVVFDVDDRSGVPKLFVPMSISRISG